MTINCLTMIKSDVSCASSARYVLCCEVVVNEKVCVAGASTCGVYQWTLCCRLELTYFPGQAHAGRRAGRLSARGLNPVI